MLVKLASRVATPLVHSQQLLRAAGPVMMSSTAEGEPAGPENIAPSPVSPDQAAEHTVLDWPLDQPGNDRPPSAHIVTAAADATPLAADARQLEVQLVQAASTAAQAASQAAKAAVQAAQVLGGATSLGAADANAAADVAAAAADTADMNAMTSARILGTISGTAAEPLPAAPPGVDAAAAAAPPPYPAAPCEGADHHDNHAKPRASVGAPMPERAFVDKLDPVAPGQVHDEDGCAAANNGAGVTSRDQDPASYLASS